MARAPLQRRRQHRQFVARAECLDPADVIQAFLAEDPIEVFRIRLRAGDEQAPFHRRRRHQADIVLRRGGEDAPFGCQIDKAPGIGDHCGVEFTRSDVLQVCRRIVGGRANVAQQSLLLQVRKAPGAVSRQYSFHRLVHGIMT